MFSQLEMGEKEEKNRVDYGRKTLNIGKQILTARQLVGWLCPPPPEGSIVVDPVKDQ